MFPTISSQPRMTPGSSGGGVVTESVVTLPSGDEVSSLELHAPRSAMVGIKMRCMFVTLPALQRDGGDGVSAVGDESFRSVGEVSAHRPYSSCLVHPAGVVVPRRARRALF